MNTEKIPNELLGTMGVVDAVVNGELYRNVANRLTFMPAETDLAKIESPNPGDFAAIYGIGTIWQWNGTQWVEV